MAFLGLLLPGNPAADLPVPPSLRGTAGEEAKTETFEIAAFAVFLFLSFLRLPAVHRTEGYCYYRRGCGGLPKGPVLPYNANVRPLLREAEKTT